MLYPQSGHTTNISLAQDREFAGQNQCSNHYAMTPNL